MTLVLLMSLGILLALVVLSELLTGRHTPDRSSPDARLSARLDPGVFQLSIPASIDAARKQCQRCPTGDLCLTRRTIDQAHMSPCPWQKAA